MGKKILVILGHPDTDSFCGGLLKAYAEGARNNGSDVRELKIGELDFDPVLWKGYNEIQELEPDLVESQQLIQWADHLAFIYPTWWGAMPSILKGFIDRIFLPGFAFQFHEDSVFWDKLLTGRTAELLVTMDTPPWFYHLIWRRPGHNQMKKTILGFCGINVTRITEFSPIKGSSEKKRERWLRTTRQLGKRA